MGEPFCSVRDRVTLYSSKTILAAEIKVAAKCIQPLRTVNAVSYTHLDVYKRQMQEQPIV